MRQIEKIKLPHRFEGMAVLSTLDSGCVLDEEEVEQDQYFVDAIEVQA